MFNTGTQEKISRDEAINLILSSIAMEELALSHVINAEGEKIQYVLGTLEDKPASLPTVEEVLMVNDSVRATLVASSQNQLVLKEKMEKALEASIMQGPTGPQGPPGDPGITITLITTSEYEALPIEQKNAPNILWVITVA